MNFSLITTHSCRCLPFQKNQRGPGDIRAYSSDYGIDEDGEPSKVQVIALFGLCAQTATRNTANTDPEIEAATRHIANVDGRLSQYLDDQSSTTGFSNVANDWSINENQGFFISMNLI